MFTTVSMFLAIFQFTDGYYNSSIQCSNYDFMLINEPVINSTILVQNDTYFKTNLEKDWEVVRFIWFISFVIIYIGVFINYLFSE